MGLWWRRRAEPGGGRDDSLPIVRLQDVSKTFKENAEEDTIPRSICTTAA